MAEITFNDFLRQSDDKGSNNSDKDFPVKFFKVAEGESAVVRFDIGDMTSPDFNDIKFYTVHKVGDFPDVKVVSCLRGEHGKIDDCPFCKAEVGRRQKRAFIKLLKYEKTEDGKIIAIPCKWERSASQRSDFLRNLISYSEELGDLRDFVFKVTRTGSGLDTQYQVIPFVNQDRFDEKIYVKDFSVLDDYGSQEDYNIRSYTKAEMEEFIETGEWPEPAVEVEDEEEEVDLEPRASKSESLSLPEDDDDPFADVPAPRATAPATRKVAKKTFGAF